MPLRHSLTLPTSPFSLPKDWDPLQAVTVDPTEKVPCGQVMVTFPGERIAGLTSKDKQEARALSEGVLRHGSSPPARWWR